VPVRQLGPSAADYHENDSANETNPAEHWGKWNVVLFVRTHLQGSGIDHFFASRVGEPAVSEGDNADNDKNDTDDASRLH